MGLDVLRVLNLFDFVGFGSGFGPVKLSFGFPLSSTMLLAFYLSYYCLIISVLLFERENSKVLNEQFC